MVRRLSSARLITVVVVLAALATGCVKQPYDASLIEGQDPGVVAEPLAQEEIAHAAGDGAKKRDKRRAHKNEKKKVRGTADVQPNARGESSTGRELAATGSAAEDEPDQRVARPAKQQSPKNSGDPRQQSGFVTLATIADRPSDAGGDAPAYAEIDRVVIESNGSTARVSVVMAGDLPAALADGEVQGIGIDFYRGDGAESDFQLFADGGYRGWRAFRHTPDGVVAYTGTFGVGENVLVFEVPWVDLGGTKPAAVRTFVDWSQQQTVLTSGSTDFAPNEGRVTVRPAT